MADQGRKRLVESILWRILVQCISVTHMEGLFLQLMLAREKSLCKIEMFFFWGILKDSLHLMTGKLFHRSLLSLLILFKLVLNRQWDAADTCHLFSSDWDHSALPEIGYEVYNFSHLFTPLGKVIVCNGFVLCKSKIHAQVHVLVLLVFSLQMCHFKIYSDKRDKDDPVEELPRGHRFR